MKPVSFKATKKETEAMSLIVKRAISLSIVRGKPLDLLMDLSAVNANGCPLDLDRLLKADDFNFAHDIHGIQFNLNRRTGKMDNCFVPRFARKAAI
jgi:hypothetical protein